VDKGDHAALIRGIGWHLLNKFSLRNFSAQRLCNNPLKTRNG
jgi:hypothetical protein